MTTPNQKKCEDSASKHSYTPHGFIHDSAFCFLTLFFIIPVQCSVELLLENAYFKMWLLTPLLFTPNLGKSLLAGCTVHVFPSTHLVLRVRTILGPLALLNFLEPI